YLLRMTPVFCCTAPATTEVYPLSLHDALPIYRGVEHVVVVGEGAHRDRIQTGGVRGPQLVGAQLFRGPVQRLRVGPARPVGLDGPLEFPVRSDPRQSQYRGAERTQRFRHVVYSVDGRVSRHLSGRARRQRIRTDRMREMSA